MTDTATTVSRSASSTIGTPRLKKMYKDVVAPKLMGDFGFTNVHQIPNLTKIVGCVVASRPVSSWCDL